MTLRELYRTLCTQIAAVEPDNAQNEAICLLELVLGGGRELLLAQGGATVAPADAACLQALCTRRCAGEPLQYLLGEWEFMGLPFFVGPGVLIPRPETELLVELALRALRPIASPCLLDLCSGSGCIPIAVGHALPDAAVLGVELSPQAYAYFEKNIARNVAKNVTPVRGDVFALPDYIATRRYHAVTANPPYIASHQLSELQREVLREPVMALDGGDDGLDFYRKLPALAAQLLLADGLLALEIGEEQGAAVAALLCATGFDRVQVVPDLEGRDRVVTGLWATVADDRC